MIDLTLDGLLNRARGHRMSVRELREQEISFVLGSQTDEGQSLHRGTITMAVPDRSKGLRAIVSSWVRRPRAIVPFDIYGSVRQFKLVHAMVKSHLGGEPVRISPELILKLHSLAGEEANPVFGAYRKVEVEVLGSQHRPPAPNALVNEVKAFCDHLNERWSAEDATTLSAYALWRLNWVHPFLDGNGRTARALCYLILNLKLDMLVPGCPTLLEQLKERREEYFDALTAADTSFAKHAEPDLAPLKQLLEELLIRQLRSLPALSGYDERQLIEIIKRRIGSLDPHSLERLFGSGQFAYRTWSTADILLVHVGPLEAVFEAEERFSFIEGPFPGLFAAAGEPAVLTLTARERGAIVRPRTFKVTAGAALRLEPNAAVVVERPAVSVLKDGLPPFQWGLDGVLYVMRRGDEITELWAYDVLDMLVTRHIREAR